MPSSRTSRCSSGSLLRAAAPGRARSAAGRGAFVALAALAATSLALRSGRAEAQPGQGRAEARTPPPAPLPSLWTTPTAGPWRLPMPGDQVAFLGARHAVVLATSPSTPNAPMLVDLTTGNVAPLLKLVPDDAGFLHLARIGNRLIAFGLDANVSAAWTLTVQASPKDGERALVATSLDPPPPPAGTAAEGPGVIVSPDERWLIWCHIDGPPTLRDAATLRVLRTLQVASCASPSFTAPNRVRLGDEEVELPSGMVRATPEEISQRAGPRRRVLEIRGDYQKLDTVYDGKKIVQRPFELYRDDLQWTPDGVAISLSREALSLRPAADGSPRTMRPRLRYGFRRIFAVSNGHALIVDGVSLELVDLNSGESKSPEGNLDTASAVVPFGGSVVSGADRLRVWRAGQQVSEEDAEIAQLRTTATRLIALDTSQQVWLWDPATNLRRLLGLVDSVSDAFLTTFGEDVWFGTQYTLEHSRAGQPARPQARFRVGLTPLAYHPRGLLALGEDPDLLTVADLASGRARQWRLAAQCELVRESLSAQRFIVRGLSDLHVVDLDGGELQIFETPGQGYPYLTESSNEDVAFAADDNTLIVWHVGDDNARQIQVPLPEDDAVRALRFSQDGQTLALGSTNGAVISVALAELRQSGQRIPMPRSQKSCFHGEPKPVSFVELGLLVSEPPPPTKLGQLPWTTAR